MENTNTIKIDAVGSRAGNAWDEKDHTEIVQIFISYDIRVCSLQFQYVNENEDLMLSDRHGQGAGDKFSVVKLNYPSEYLTCVSGTYNATGLTSIAFGTNKETHGPFGKPLSTDRQLMLHLGLDRQFGGFHGAADNLVRSIGVYINPITTLKLPKKKDESKLGDVDEDKIAII